MPERDSRLYLKDIQDAAARITSYCEGITGDQFLADQKTQDAVVRNLEVIGEAARTLPEEVRGLAPEIEWRKIVGLRNILIHQYFGVNPVIVWDLVTNKLPALAAACGRLMDQTRPQASERP